MNKKDPAGYYELLGIPETASAAEIKSVFRQKVKDLHPDRNPSQEATQQFLRLNEAYQVLSNPDNRARYDTLYAHIPQSETIYSQRVVADPIVCSCCKKVTAQPRYIIFFQVKSFIVLTIRTPIQGIFCSKCAENKSVESTIITWLLGWWGLPWGFLYSVEAIFRNLLGGNKPNDVNTYLLVYQAWVFARQNKIELARAIAADAKDIAEKSVNLVNKEDHDNALKLTEELLSALNADKSIKRFKNVWSIPNGAFYLQGSILITVIVIILSAIGYSPARIIQSVLNKFPISYSPNPSPNIDPSANPSPNIDPPANPSSNIDLPTNPFPNIDPPQYIRPSTADNGIPFPLTSSYIDGYPMQATDGSSRVIVDNLQNNSDVFVKLFSLDIDSPQAVRVFFIRAHEKFVIENISRGNYDIRYRDLDSGRLARTDPFNLMEIETSEGVEFNEITLTLYKVYGGNMQTYPISENEF